MYTVPVNFHPKFEPVANPDAIVWASKVRFTVLTPQLIRLEYDPQERFEDRASQAFWYRRQPVPDFTVSRTGSQVEIETQALRLVYDQSEDRLSPTSLTIRVKDLGTLYRMGDAAIENLGGTYRTLDAIDGKVELEPGLVSPAGWAVYDDSNTLVFDAEGWLEPRRSVEGALDLYFFGYGRNYLRCIQDLQKIAGQTPLLPRWSLGNWWSRYFEYSEQQLKDLMLEFKRRRVPLSVCIVDMDWHITATGNESSGWTGYTWNRALFPDPPAFIDWLHQMGLKTALNLHPAEGIWPHEEAYPVMAEALGVDPAGQEALPFDIADRKFTQAYFEILHHPYEAQGIDFWWMDWQQGQESQLEGLDPLWWLNHLHFYDLGRDGVKRPFVFSRWGGLGNHRYPIGFSGDTIITWDSLAFQPYFTATAANVGYGWWSHDIGGHFFGMEDGELFTRWVQFGVFSPILRMHATKDPYIDHCPWAYDAGTFQIAREALRLRHALIPYLYSMSLRNEKDGIPLVLPMYYEHPEAQAAYHCPQQYLFGSELLAAPVTTPALPDLRMSKQAVWLPKGDWFDFFSGEHYPGDAWYAQYVKLEETPVFARAGAIVPLAHGEAVDGVANPAALDVWVFPGADRRFELFEDDGETTAYRQGQYRLTAFSQEWGGRSLKFRVHPAQGLAGAAPDPRTYFLSFKGVNAPESLTVLRDGRPLEVETRYDAAAATLCLAGIELAAAGELVVTLSTQSGSLIADTPRPIEKCRRLLWDARIPTFAKSRIDQALPDILEDITRLAQFDAVLTETQMQALVETLAGVGSFRMSNNSNTERIVLWNNRRDPRFRYRVSLMIEAWQAPDCYDEGEAPPWKVILPDEHVRPGENTSWDRAYWKLALNYANLYRQAYLKGQEVKPGAIR